MSEIGMKVRRTTNNAKEINELHLNLSIKRQHSQHFKNMNNQICLLCKTVHYNDGKVHKIHSAIPLILMFLYQQQIKASLYRINLEDFLFNRWFPHLPVKFSNLHNKMMKPAVKHFKSSQSINFSYCSSYLSYNK
jgi:hypothetical protein